MCEQSAVPAADVAYSFRPREVDRAGEYWRVGSCEVDHCVIEVASLFGMVRYVLPRAGPVRDFDAGLSGAQRLCKLMPRIQDIARPEHQRCPAHRAVVPGQEGASEWREAVARIAVLDENLVAREGAEETREERGLRPSCAREFFGGARPVQQLLGQSGLARSARNVERYEAVEHRLEHHDLRRRELAP